MVADDVKRWAVAAPAGSVPAVAAHGWFILGPSGSLLGRVTKGHFHEVQRAV